MNYLFNIHYKHHNAYYQLQFLNEETEWDSGEKNHLITASWWQTLNSELLPLSLEVQIQEMIFHNSFWEFSVWLPRADLCSYHLAYPAPKYQL